jgi:hypothetical protein
MTAINKIPPMTPRVGEGGLPGFFWALIFLHSSGFFAWFEFSGFSLFWGAVNF